MRIVVIFNHSIIIVTISIVLNYLQKIFKDNKTLSENCGLVWNDLFVKGLNHIKRR